MKFISTIVRWLAQYAGFLAILQVMPDYRFIIFVRFVIYKTSYGFVVVGIDFLLFSFAFDQFLIWQRERLP